MAPAVQRPGLIAALPRLFQRSPDPKAVLAALTLLCLCGCGVAVVLLMVDMVIK